MFILCVEGISALLHKVEICGELTGCKICRRAPRVAIRGVIPITVKMIPQRLKIML